MSGKWTVVYRDTDKIIEQRVMSADADGYATVEERTTFINPAAPEARLEAVEVAVAQLP